jgi:DNA-binding phage protein
METLLSPGVNKVTVALLTNEFAEACVFEVSSALPTGFEGLDDASRASAPLHRHKDFLELFAMHLDPTLSLFKGANLQKKVDGFRDTLIANLDNEHQAFKKLSRVFKKHGITKEDLVASIHARGVPALPLLVYMANVLKMHMCMENDFVYCEAAEQADAYMEVRMDEGIMHLHPSGYKTAVVKKKMNEANIHKLRVAELRTLCALLGFSKSTALKADYIAWLTETLK